MLKKVNDLKVACRNEDCVWHGKLGGYLAHSCPSPVSDVLDISMLQFLLMFDERNEVKIAAFECITRRVFNARRTSVNENYLSMVYLYSIRLNDVIEVQGQCLDVMLEAVRISNGGNLVLCCCEGVIERLKELCTIPYLAVKALLLRKCLERGVEAMNETDEALNDALGFLVRTRTKVIQ